MMRMAIEGVGVVGSFGNGLEALTESARVVLCGGALAPAAGQADTEPLKEYMPARALRRVDHFTRLTLLAAFSALSDAGLTPADLTETGIVLATGYGPARLTFDFLDSIIDHGPEMASPLAFSHSVHNIPAATVALTMQVTGPCTTVSQFETSVGAALLTARAWLAEGRVARVLVGAADEQTHFLQLASAAVAAGMDAARSGGRRHLPVGDGAVFLSLHADPGRARRGFITDVDFNGTAPTALPECPVFLSGAAGPASRTACGDTVHDLSRVYGNLPVAMAFDIAIASQAVACSLQPVIAPVGTIRCESRDRFGNTASVAVAGGGA